jgi:Mn-dependent DtxR family transcriptional regulator
MATAPEKQVIALLAKEWDMSGPPGIMDVSDIVTALPLAPTETLAAMRDLFANGLIDMNKLKTSAFLTPEGYAAADRERKRKGEKA